MAKGDAFRSAARATRTLKALKSHDMATHQGPLAAVTMRRQTRVSKGGFRRKGAMTVTRTTSPGSIMGNPATDFAHAFRRKLKPIQVAPCVITNAEGVVIAEIHTDPVTGTRTRVPR